MRFTFPIAIAVLALFCTQHTKAAGGGTAFDGAWTVTINFHSYRNPDGTEAKGWSKVFPGTVKNGVFYGDFGIKGKDGWYSLGGNIEADGSANLTVAGITGDPAYTPVHPKPGFHFQYQVLAHFSGRQGTGHSVGDPAPPHTPRTRVYTFTKV